MSLLLNEPLSTSTVFIFIDGSPARFDRETRKMLPPIQFTADNLLYCILQPDEVPEARRAAVAEYGKSRVKLVVMNVYFEPATD